MRLDCLIDRIFIRSTNQCFTNLIRFSRYLINENTTIVRNGYGGLRLDLFRCSICRTVFPWEDSIR